MGGSALGRAAKLGGGRAQSVGSLWAHGLSSGCEGEHGFMGGTLGGECDCILSITFIFHPPMNSKSLLGVFILCVATCVSAQIVQVEVSGRIDSVRLTPSHAAVGDPFSASFKFDNSSRPVTTFSFADSYPLLSEFSFSIGNYTASYAGTFLVLHVGNGYEVYAGNRSGIASLNFNTLSPVSLPFLNLQLTDFSSVYFGMAEFDTSPAGGEVPSATGRVTSLTLSTLPAGLQAVPEPSTYGLMAGAALLGAALFRRRFRSTTA